LGHAHQGLSLRRRAVGCLVESAHLPRSRPASGRRRPRCGRGQSGQAHHSCCCPRWPGTAATCTRGPGVCSRDNEDIAAAGDMSRSGGQRRDSSGTCPSSALGSDRGSVGVVGCPSAMHRAARPGIVATPRATRRHPAVSAAGGDPWPVDGGGGPGARGRGPELPRGRASPGRGSLGYAGPLHCADPGAGQPEPGVAHIVQGRRTRPPEQDGEASACASPACALVAGRMGPLRRSPPNAPRQHRCAAGRQALPPSLPVLEGFEGRCPESWVALVPPKHLPNRSNRTDLTPQTTVRFWSARGWRRGRTAPRGGRGSRGPCRERAKLGGWWPAASGRLSGGLVVSAAEWGKGGSISAIFPPIFPAC
jgi:hypothetical protein